MNQIKNSRSFTNWLYRPTVEESVCDDPFHNICLQVMQGVEYDALLNPVGPDPTDYRTKLAQLIKAKLIYLEGDVIYVREHDDLHPLNNAIPLLAYYMHSDTKEAKQAASLLESTFLGYFPIVQDEVVRDSIRITDFSGQELEVYLPTLSARPDLGKVAEFGKHVADERLFEPLATFFALLDEAVGEQFFFEKTLLYPFTRPYREKSHVLVGGGGNGKSMFMKMVQRLYGEKALTDAPQPTFKGHDAGVISYGFIGRRVVTFNDVGNPSAQFLEWLKRMITGNLEVKTPNGSWMSVPCNANFMMETNHQPEILDLEAHRRRYIIRTFDPSFRLASEMAPEQLDLIGDKGDVTAADIVSYLLMVKSQIDDWTAFSAPPSKEVMDAVSAVSQQDEVAY